MSLEAAIQENTAALRDLIAHLGAGLPAANDDKHEKKVKLTVVKPEPAPATPASGESPASKAITFDDVRVPFVAMATKKGNAAVVAVLAKFGIDAAKGGKLSQVKPEQWPAVLEEIKKASA